MLAATVLIPTHNHVTTLRTSIASALAQTTSDIEVFVIGDGVPDESREIMRNIMAEDARVRFFDNPKGPRHGEIWRDQALAEAQGRIVCYLSDDDLYLPNHVQTMAKLLDEADFAHALLARVTTSGQLFTFTVDLAQAVYRRELIEGRNRIPLSAGAHTLEAYRRLPKGWETTPAGTPTDLYMWQKFLRLNGCRFVAGRVLTVLNFPDAERRGQNPADRFEELRMWKEWMDRGEAARWNEALLAAKFDEAVQFETRILEASLSAAPQFGTFQVFYPVAGAYSEECSRRIAVPFGTWRTVAISLPKTDAVVRLRIDPVSTACQIQISEISLRTPNGEILWELLPGLQHELNTIGVSAMVCRDGVIGLLSETDDPQIFLPPVATPSPVILIVRLKLDAISAKPDAISMSLNLLRLRSISEDGAACNS